MGIRFAMVCVTLAASACGGDDRAFDAGEDAALDALVDGGAFGPVIPWLAEAVPSLGFTPCPDGWRPVTTDGVTTCDPYPEAGPSACDVGEAHFLGTPSCAPIGAPCPAGDFAEALPTDAPIIYVKAGAPAGGDGTRGTPYATLSQVPWLSVPEGGTVALAKGSYEGTLPLDPGTRVVGACVAETILTGTTAPVMAVVFMRSAGPPALVSNLSIVDAPQSAAVVSDGRSLELEGVLIGGATQLGVLVFGPESVLSARRTVITGTRPSDAGAYGRAVNVEVGGRFDATHLVVEDSRDIGIFASASELVLHDVAVRTTRARASDGTRGRGLEAQEGSVVDGRRILVDDNFGTGLLSVGSDFTLEDAIVRRTGGRGVGVQPGGTLTATRLLVEDNLDIGLVAAGQVMLTGSVIRGTRERESDGTYGFGISCQGGGQLEADGLLVEDNREVGLHVSSESVAVLRDAVVRGTRERVADDRRGRGVNVQGGAMLDVARLLVEDNRETGIAGAGGELALTDVVVRDTGAQASDDGFGHGIGVQDAARLSGERVVIDGAREVGLVASSGSDVELGVLTVTNVEQSASTLLERTSGHAVASVDAAVRLSDFTLRDAATCGALLSPSDMVAPTEIDLTSGVVEGMAIGACVQVAGYDLARLSDAVEYRDNGANLESTDLPVPGVPGAIDE